MADAKKCDICKKYFDYDDKEQNKISFYTLMERGSRLTNAWDADICPECLGAVKELLERLGGKNG